MNSTREPLNDVAGKFEVEKLDFNTFEKINDKYLAEVQSSNPPHVAVNSELPIGNIITNKATGDQVAVFVVADKNERRVEVLSIDRMGDYGLGDSYDGHLILGLQKGDLDKSIEVTQKGLDKKGVRIPADYLEGLVSNKRLSDAISKAHMKSEEKRKSEAKDVRDIHQEIVRLEKHFKHIRELKETENAMDNPMQIMASMDPTSVLYVEDPKPGIVTRKSIQKELNNSVPFSNGEHELKDPALRYLVSDFKPYSKNPDEITNSLLDNNSSYIENGVRVREKGSQAGFVVAIAVSHEYDKDKPLLNIRGVTLDKRGDILETGDEALKAIGLHQDSVIYANTEGLARDSYYENRPEKSIYSQYSEKENDEFRVNSIKNKVSAGYMNELISKKTLTHEHAKRVGVLDGQPLFDEGSVANYADSAEYKLRVQRMQDDFVKDYQEHLKFENALKEYKEKEIERIKKIDDEAFGLVQLMDSYRKDPDFSMNKVGIVGTNEDELWRKATREHIGTEEQRRFIEDKIYLAVLAPNKFMLDQDGKAVLYDHEAAANALAQAREDEYINLNTIDGTTLIARNVVKDPSSISVLEEDDEVYLSTKIKSEPDKDDYTALYAVRTVDKDNEPINMILAERIVDGKVVSTNEEAMHAVGLDPTMFVTKVTDIPRPGENGFTHEDLDITTATENNIEQIRLMTQLSPGGLAEIINKANLDKNLKQRAELGGAATAPVNAGDVMSADDLKREGDVKTLRAMSGFDQTTTVRQLSEQDLIALNYATGVYSPRNKSALSDTKEKYNVVKKEGLVTGVAITQKTKLSTDYSLVSTSVIRAKDPYSTDIDVITTTYEKSFKSVTPGYGLKNTVNISEKLGNIERVGYLDANIMSSEFANKSFSPLNEDGTTNPDIKINNVVNAEEVVSVLIDNGFENWVNIQNTRKGMFRKNESINTYDQMAKSIEKTQLETSQEKDIAPEQDVKKDKRGGLKR